MYDLLYWEHRMSRWLGLKLLGLDISHNVVCLYNNRRLLRKLLSIPERDRRNSIIFRKIISNLWPQALEFPINPHKDSAYMHKLMRYVRGLAFRMPLPFFRVASQLNNSRQ